MSTLTDGDFGCPCAHEHITGPAECDEIEHLIEDISCVLEEKRYTAMVKAAASAAIVATAATDTADHDADVVAELNERAEELQGYAKHLDLYVRHMLRKALSHTITPKLLDELKENLRRVHLIADYIYKAKPLPAGWRKTQTAAFGKKGLSLHDVTAMRWDPTRGDLALLNVRVVCDDSEQTWFHTLAALRTSLDKLTDAWIDANEATMQTDGANNYDCTAFMSSVQDVFKAVGLRLKRHVVTEVGDGKNLCDQDFQGAQQEMDHARAGGMDLLNAQNILDALETGKALGVINVGMDLGTRALEPKNPTALKGIDSLYDREYEYGDVGNLLGVRVRQFFGLGAGRLVTVGELHQLWQVGFDASVIDPVVMLPSNGARTTVAMAKLSQPHKLEKCAVKQARFNARAQRRTASAFAAMAAERQRLQESTSIRCQFAERGCRHRRFLLPTRVASHEAGCRFNPLHEAAARTATVHVRVKVGGVVRLSLSGSGRVGPYGNGSVVASLSLIEHGPAAARVTLFTRRPAIGRAYGMQPHNAVHVLSTAEARRAAAVTQGKAVGVQLQACKLENGSTHVSLRLTPRRTPPEVRARGWAIRPPPSTERYTTERVGYLRELYDWPDGRLNEFQAFELFRKRFAANDGPYARSLRLTRAQIKAWFGSEKARRKKAGMAAALKAALPDDPNPDSEGGGTGRGRGSRGVGRGRGRGGVGRGCGRGGVGQGRGRGGSNSGVRGGRGRARGGRAYSGDASEPSCSEEEEEEEEVCPPPPPPTHTLTLTLVCPPLALTPCVPTPHPHPHPCVCP